jgi:hypothetical protein
VKLRLGNDATHYHEFSATTRFRGNMILGGFSTIGFDLASRTDTGVVTDTNIVWVQVVINHGVTGVNGVYRLDNIFLSQGIYFSIPYYSINNVLDENGVPKSSVTALTDNILVPFQSKGAIIYKALELIASSPNIKDQSAANYFARELKPKEDLLKSLYPVQRLLVQSVWYKRSNFRVRKY